MEDGRAGYPCRCQLGVVRRDCGGDHYLGVVGEVGGTVADNGLDAGFSESFAVARHGLVGARDGGAELLCHKRQAAHARAADAYEMQLPTGERRIEGIHHGRRR